MNRKTKYILHEHLADRAGRHYDLRIKYLNKNLLASWALPKAEIPTQVGEKKLAVQTEDHGRYWLHFEGDIPKGEYGAGTIKIAQKGEMVITIWTDKLIIFYVEGDIMNGKYILARFKDKKNSSKTWVLIKGNDAKEESQEGEQK